MLDRRLTLALFALCGCTPRPTANLPDPATTTPEPAAPEQTKPQTSAQSSGARWIGLSVESEFGCAVERTGSVYCWGRGPSAEMGLRELPPQPGEPAVFGTRKWGPPSRLELIDDARAVSTATGLACAIVEDGRVRCWGAFRWSSPHVYDVPGVTRAAALDLGDGESCATLESGELWCWSGEGFGIPTLRLTGTLAVSVGDSVACGLTAQGDVSCWGQGVADWHRYDQQFNQGQAPQLPGAAADEEFPDSVEIGRFRGAVDLALTNWNSLCVLRSDGKVACSTRDLFAILRGEELGLQEVPDARGVAELSATRSHVCGRTLDGHALCWGRNVYGQLGNGESSSSDRAVAVTELADVLSLSVAEDFSCALTRADQIACWGFDRGEALAREEVHVHTVEGVRASSMAAAGHMTCISDATKQIRCWGSESIESQGIAGAAKPARVDLPVGHDLLGMTSSWESCFLLGNDELRCGNWSSYGGPSTSFIPTLTTQAVQGIGASLPPACAIVGKGSKATLQCGQSFAQLEPESRIKGPTALSSANMRACVVHGGGKVSCFSEYYYWGDGPRPVRELVTIPGISDAVAVTSGLYHDCALRKDGHVSCWVGRTESEWSEDGRQATAVHYRMSDQADMGLEQIVQLVSGTQFHCALSKAGEVRCWDDSPYAEQINWSSVPELGAGVVELAAGFEHTCARRKDGSVTCWGDDVWGQLGRVPSRVYLTPTPLKID